MDARPERTFDEKVEYLKHASKDERPALIAELREEIEAQRQHEQEIEEFVRERDEHIRERGIDSKLQRIMRVEP